jgi:large subunit ribosomal protein L10
MAIKELFLNLIYRYHMEVKQKMASENILKQKQAQVSELAEKMKSAKLILLAEYRGINVSDVTELRRKLRKANSEYSVVKNNITKRALAECKIEGLDDELTGPVAVILGNEDYLEPSKIIYEFTKANEYYKIKAGVIDGKVASAKEIITLAQLPSREVLIAKLAGSLLGNITKLAIALDQVKNKKEQEA